MANCMVFTYTEFLLHNVLYLICFQGPLTVCVQELDGSFNHTVQIEDVYSRHELPCHSKSRRLDINTMLFHI